MKKFLFSLTAAAFALTATAAGPTIIDKCAYIGLMPTIVTAKGESYIIADSSNKISIYDKNLQNKATITLPEKQVAELTQWSQHRNNGTWGDRNEYTIPSYKYNCTEMYLDFIGADTNPYMATQTFFNNDSKFEYIVPKYEIKDYLVENDDYRSGGQKLIITAYEIKSQDGTTLITLTIPEEYKSNFGGGDGSAVTGIIIDDKKYVKCSYAIETEEEDSDERLYASLFYEIDGTSGVKAPAMVMEGAMKVHPTLPRRGETVTVDLGAAAQPGCSIAVTAVNGRNALNLRAEKGETSVNIPTASLATGMYIVTVTNGTSSTEAAKIIIR